MSSLHRNIEKYLKERQYFLEKCNMDLEIKRIEYSGDFLKNEYLVHRLHVNQEEINKLKKFIIELKEITS